jgi:hypothetical protein
MTPTRGERNFNPGNIDFNKATKWQGLASPAIESGVAKPRFARFQSAEWGIRAIARLLITYQDKYDLHTVRGLIDRWAPPRENDTDAYVEAVAAKLKVSPDEGIDVHEYRTMRILVEAIIKHENGRCIYSGATIDEGLRRAGVVPSMRTSMIRTSLSAEGVGTSTTGIGAAGAVLTETAQQMQLATPDGSLIMQGVCALLVVGGISLTVYGLIKRAKGRSA